MISTRERDQTLALHSDDDCGFCVSKENDTNKNECSSCERIV